MVVLHIKLILTFWILYYNESVSFLKTIKNAIFRARIFYIYHVLTCSQLVFKTMLCLYAVHLKECIRKYVVKVISCCYYIFTCPFNRRVAASFCSASGRSEFSEMLPYFVVRTYTVFIWSWIVLKSKSICGLAMSNRSVICKYQESECTLFNKHCSFE